MSDWNFDMDAAPRDGSTILLLYKDGGRTGRWEADKYTKKPRPFWLPDRWSHRLSFAREEQPTAWMLVPGVDANRETSGSPGLRPLSATLEMLRAQIGDIEGAAKDGPQSIYSARIKQICEDMRGEISSALTKSGTSSRA